MGSHSQLIRVGVRKADLILDIVNADNLERAKEVEKGFGEEGRRGYPHSH